MYSKKYFIEYSYFYDRLPIEFHFIFFLQSPGTSDLISHLINQDRTIFR